MLKKAIFWDRDGVINKVIFRNGKPSSPWLFDEFEILPEAPEGLKWAREKGFLNIVFSNQPDIKRGFLKIEELEKMHEKIMHELPVDFIKLCSHDDADNCQCRKPSPGMILEAAKELMIDLENSYVVGDSRKDIEAGNKAGCKTVLLSREYNKDVKNYKFIIHNIKELYENIH